MKPEVLDTMEWMDTKINVILAMEIEDLGDIWMA